MTKLFEHPRWSDEAMAPVEITSSDEREDDSKNEPTPPRATGR